MILRFPAPTRRIAASLLIVGFMAIALANGFDRLSVRTPSLTRFVPDVLAADSLHAETALLIGQAKYVEALRKSREALGATPGEGRGASTYALANLFAGNVYAADRALQVAQMAGRRDPKMLAVSASLAIDRGEFAQAARDVEALHRGNPRLAGVEELVAALVSADAGREALYSQMAASPEWAANLLAGGGPKGLGVRAALLEQPNAQPLGCAIAAPVVTRMLESGMRREADASWKSQCGERAKDGLVADPDFARLARGDRLDPFGWRRERSGDLSLAFAKRGSRQVLEVRNSAAVSRKILSQPVRLMPGVYRASVQTNGAGTGNSWLQLDCGTGTGKTSLRPRSELLTVPEACDAQELWLWLKPTEDRIAIRSVRIEPVS